MGPPSLLSHLADFRPPWRSLLGWIALSAMAIALPAAAAERIEFFVGPFEPVIYVEDLAEFAANGTINERLNFYASRLSEAQRTELRAFLNQRLDVQLTSIAQASYWQVGERFLDQLGQVVKTDSFRNGSRALRAALILAAADGDGITPIEVMQVYPLEVIQLDYELLQEVIQESREFFAARSDVMAQLRAIAMAEAIAYPIPTNGIDPRNPGPYSWQRETLTFVNPPRQGTIPFDLYLPQFSPTKPVPIVVFSHGVASGRGAFGYLARHLASHGYAVVVPQHDDDNQKYEPFLAGVDGPPNPLTLVTRPRDLSRVLDVLEQLASMGGPYAQLDTNNVGVLGHSLGGFTVLAAAGATFNFEQLQHNCSLEDRDRPSLNPSLLVQCDLLDLADQAPFQLRDERIQAVFALNPPTSLFFGEMGLAQIEIPTFLVAAFGDIVVPAIPEQIQPYRWLQTEHSYLAVIENATHFSFIEGDLDRGAIPLPSVLLGPAPQLARPYLNSLSLSFFNRFLRNDVAAEGYLTQPYLDALGGAPFQATVIREFK